MFGFGMPELSVILLIVVVIFGAGKLPEIGGALGKSISNFRMMSHDEDERQISLGREDGGGGNGCI